MSLLIKGSINNLYGEGAYDYSRLLSTYKPRLPLAFSIFYWSVLIAEVIVGIWAVHLIIDLLMGTK